jgi:type VII secretion ATPase EccA
LGSWGSCSAGLSATVAWVYGNKALDESDSPPGAATNRSVVQAVRICGIVGTVLLALPFVSFIATFALRSLRAEGRAVLDSRRARATWVSGARAFHRSDRAIAAERFAAAVDLDTGMADAWLGLHAVGQRHEEAITEMAAHHRRFGEERRRHNLALASRYSIGTYVTYSLESEADLWCAVAAGHLDRGDHEPAATAIAVTSPESVTGRFLRGRNAFAQGATDDSIMWLRLVIQGDDHFLQCEARLLSGIALAEAGAIGPALEHLRWVLNATFLPEAHPEAHYWLGIIERERGSEAAAMDHFHRAYAQRPHFPGLKEAMAQHEPLVRVRVERSDTVEQAPTIAPESPVDAPETVEEVMAELERLVGQEAIKRQVRALLAQMRAHKARSDAGLQQPRMTKHFVFRGPPGTGKTIVARVLGRLYKALGILESGHVIEVDRSGLVGEFLGSTPARTKARLDDAMGGVLFIDEAYTLQAEGINGGDAYGQEAIDTILKRMEDDRDRFIVIAAGYPERMDRFLGSNPGLRSRFTTTVEFERYSADELLQIAATMADAAGDRLTPSASETLRSHLLGMEHRGELAAETFGNARYVRTLMEHAAEERNLRVFADGSASPDHDAMTDIAADDISAAAAAL